MQRNGHGSLHLDLTAELEVDGWTLSYNGWKDDAREIEWPSVFSRKRVCARTVEHMFERMGTKQAEHDGVRDHKNLRELDQLKAALEYEGWHQDAKLAEETHREHPGLVPPILDTMRRKQQVHSGDRSHPYIRRLDALMPTLSYSGREDDARKIESPRLDDASDALFHDVKTIFERMGTKQAEHDGVRDHKNLLYSRLDRKSVVSTV